MSSCLDSEHCTHGAITPVHDPGNPHRKQLDTYLIVSIGGARIAPVSFTAPRLMEIEQNNNKNPIQTKGMHEV